jgi:hypothetical protein
MRRNTGGLADVLRAAQDAEAMSELREQLDGLVFTSHRTITRDEINALLRIVISNLAPRLEEVDYTEKLEIIKEHKAIGQLKHFKLALQDLDRGIVHEALKPATNQANAALSSEQMEYDSLLLELVAIVQVRERYTTLREAERHVAERLQKAGVKRRGKTVTPSTLRSLRNHPKKSQARYPQPQ